MRSSDNIIRRGRLLKYAEHISGDRILYVQAPAGFGKTVFARQWLELKKAPYRASVLLDEYDNTVDGLCLKLGNALLHLCSEEEEKRIAVYTQHIDFDRAPVEYLMRAAAALPADRSGSLVIDDLHYLTASAAQKALKDFLLHLPAGIMICILSRNSLPKLYGDLILKNRLQFISQEQMLFDSNEILEMYRNRGLRITKKQAEDILRYTDGWPVGLNALLLSENKIPSDRISDNWLDDFLEIQVWNRWSESLQEFMVGICMEEEFSEGLCEALTKKKKSGATLKRLQAQGAFLYRQRDGMYRFHRLFQEFLKKKFFARPEEYRRGQIQTAGEWHEEHGDYYHAIDRYTAIGDYAAIDRCFIKLGNINRGVFDPERMMRAVHTAIGHDITQQYPHLYSIMAYTARNEGRIQDFEDCLDNYYANYTRIIKDRPERSCEIFFLLVMDPRFSIEDISKRAAAMHASENFHGAGGSVSLYMPLYHRSFRDFSELLLGDFEKNMGMYIRTLGRLLGEEQDMLVECIRAGLYYEQGKLSRAREGALLALSRLKKEFAPESKFCAMMLYFVICHAQNDSKAMKDIQENVRRMIEEDKAFYLQPNFDAALIRSCIDNQDTEAARNWLAKQEGEDSDTLNLFRLYRHFLSIRAHILVGNYDQAIILSEKNLAMCRRLKRPIDVIELEILLAASYGKKEPRYRKKAMAYLSDAVETAQTYGYEQAFANDGILLENMLYRLKNWVMRSDYEGPLLAEFVKKIYFEAAEQSRNRRGCTEYRETRQQIRFTDRQKEVAQLMCEGYSYRQIAEKLGVAFSTVRSHIELIYRKLDVANMTDAVLKIRKLNIL